MGAPGTQPHLSAQPFHFGTGSRALFGWLHAPGGASRGAGVVLLNPIGDDYVRAHRPFRHLAERLAKAGFWVLRFDFHGTGDSSGAETDPGRVEAWLQDVGLAERELRERSGVSDVALVGLRLGGTVAAAARAVQGEVDDLVLWNPYPGGAAFVSEVTKLDKMHRMLEPRSFASEPKGWDAGGEQALGFLLTPETIAGLRGLDLLALRARPARRTLIVGGGPTPAEEALAAHLRSLGGEVDQSHVPGQKFLVQINHLADLPTDAMNAIQAWLEARHPVLAGEAPPAPEPPRLGSAPYGEEPIVFGRAHPLFGILVHPPAAKRDARRPAIIMTNAGCVHRIGAHRFYVSLARRWADLGFTVLRLDLSGIGDSPAAPGCPENVTYPPPALQDLEDAMQVLTRATGAERFIVLGLCSGGDLAFQLGFRDRRVAGAVMMNPRTFCVHDLAMVDAYEQARYYEDSFFRPESWRKALRGEVNFRRAASMLAPKIVGAARRQLERFLAGARGGRGQAGKADEPVETSTPKEVVNDVPACLRMMAGRGVDTFLVVSEKDPGVDYVDGLFGREMAALSSVRGFRRKDFLGTGHTFTSLHTQREVSEVLTQHLVARHAG